ncbi:MAG: hypothetical protein PHS33_08985 [Candidatus Omnitrophica bacterium]|nr:hypothetical protein [Candidatus Omnitrophota bacterium]
MGFSRNKSPVVQSDTQRQIQAEIHARAAVKSGNVDPSALAAINTEDFSFAGKSNIPNEAVIAAAQNANGAAPISGIALNPEIEAIVAKAKNKIATVSSPFKYDPNRGMISSEVFTTTPQEPVHTPIAMNKTAMKDELEKRKANMILKRNSKMKQIEWSKEGNLKVEIADINREIKKLDNQIQGLK